MCPSLLQDGDNTIDIWLGDGWYRSRMMWPRNEIINTWGDKVAAIAELRSASGEPDLSQPTRRGQAASRRS